MIVENRIEPVELEQTGARVHHRGAQPVRIDPHLIGAVERPASEGWHNILSVFQDRLSGIFLFSSPSGREGTSIPGQGLVLPAPVRALPIRSA